MSKQAVAHPGHEILLSDGKEQAINTHNGLGAYPENMLRFFFNPKRLHAHMISFL